MSMAHLALGEIVWPLDLLNGDQVWTLSFEAYNHYSESQKDVFSALGSSAIDPRDNDALAKVVECIRQHDERDHAINFISVLLNNNDTVACQAALDLVARLISMVEVGSLETGHGWVRRTGPSPAVVWTDGTLTNLIAKQFPISCHRSCDSLSISLTLDAWGLENIAGIRIEFTDNLADHLRLTNNNTQLYVFHHVAYLEQQRRCPTSTLPEGLAEETLKTLAIFFPQSDYCGSLRSRRKKRVWLDRLRSQSGRIIDRQLTWCGTSNLESRQLVNFRYWKNRLLVLKDEFDHSTPDSFSQWWHDRRNGVQWHNFWVAILVLGLTAMFGFIQCILAAIQVHKAYHPAP
ncbi:uncharacterized protein B0J16DRAFT_181080 [Fusarium flagelliforme]|uniref:uncharacterized protein n=1 Tax=Fusarium flagelliforme TaxID=2675880 RepID=UPI001E8E650C|nr:uncharacterized protein B0J16DRAFT_181080 [Fusarium flagelliforme]KAH7174314.1 hypothetical protein B0J16DRAFT_181080 [Fusarium flagelliforme]